MKSFRIASALVVTLSLAHAAAAQTPAPALGASSDAKVTVISTGTGPKRALRYKAVAGSKERLDMTMKMSVEVAIPGEGAQAMDAPAVNMGMNIDITSVSPNGDIGVALVITEASMEGAGIPPGVLDPVKGLAAVMTMTPRGLVKEMKFDESKIVDPMMKQVLSSSGLDRLAAPMPEEEVGVGAKWVVEQALDANGIQMTQKSTFEVVAMDPTSTTLALALEQSAAEQKITPPGMPGNVSATIVEMKGTGTGQMALVDGVMALVGEMQLKSNVTMDISAEGQQQRMTTATGMKMTIARGKR